VEEYLNPAALFSRSTAAPDCSPGPEFSGRNSPFVKKPCYLFPGALALYFKDGFFSDWSGAGPAQAENSPSGVMVVIEISGKSGEIFNHGGAGGEKAGGGLVAACNQDAADPQE
jgi:hypothetical protein